MRDDLYPFSFGGNKARKAIEFFKRIDSGNYDVVVTYGAPTSNHSRIVSNLSSQKGLECHVVVPRTENIEQAQKSFNYQMVEMLGATIHHADIIDVSNTIEQLLSKLKEQGKSPFFIPGGGHGMEGTEAYIKAYEEIRQFEDENNVLFDYIFLPSGTGATQAGLVIGNYIQDKKTKIIGISTARNFDKGFNAIKEAVKDYCHEHGIESSNIIETIHFETRYNFSGPYDKQESIADLIDYIFISEGIPLDLIYTGKAFYGMSDYIQTNNLRNKNILFRVC